MVFREIGQKRLVDSVDRKRVDFIKKYFKVEWCDRAIYPLSMINAQKAMKTSFT